MIDKNTKNVKLLAMDSKVETKILLEVISSENIFLLL